MKGKPVLISIAFLFISSSLIAQVMDKDGNNYSAVQIGAQVWISSNLNVSHFRNGDIIPEVEDSAGWVHAGKDGKPAWCYYNRDPANGSTYGKLYNWYAVNDPRGLAPDNWHIPTDAEWTVLKTYLGGDMQGNEMKATSGWSDDGNGTNKSGFAGLPGVSRLYDGSFNDLIGRVGAWWSSSEFDASLAWYGYIFSDDDALNKDNANKWCGFSVRCIKN